MNPQDAERLYSVFITQGWASYLSFKQAKIDLLHRQLETCAPDKAAFIQGRIAEIREDFDLQSKVNAFLENPISPVTTP